MVQMSYVLPASAQQCMGGSTPGNDGGGFDEQGTGDSGDCGIGDVSDPGVGKRSSYGRRGGFVFNRRAASPTV